MKSETEIRQRLRRIQRNKAVAKYKGRDVAYIVNCKVEKLFKWVLDEEDVKINKRGKKK